MTVDLPRKKKNAFYSSLVNKFCEVIGVDFVANTENNVEVLKSMSTETERLQVKWRIGLQGDSDETVIFVMVLF